MYPYQYAFAFAQSIRCGWNLGNTFDSVVRDDRLDTCHTPVDYETAWGNPAANRGMLEAVRDAGFDAIRIPVTWFQHIIPESNYRIDPDWLARIDYIVREAFSLGFRVILNVHHDCSPSGNIRLNPQALDAAERSLCALWEQIAAQFADLGESLVFEVMNEPHTQDDWTGNPDTYAAVNRLNRAAVRTIRAGSGYNPIRFLLIPTYAATFKVPALKALQIPDDDRILVSVHAYTPTEYCFAESEVNWNKPMSHWGTQDDINALIRVFDNLEEYIVHRGAPVVLGEMSVAKKTDAVSRLLWTAVYAKEAARRNMPIFWWDNGYLGDGQMGLLNRQTLEWDDPMLVSILTGHERT